MSFNSYLFNIFYELSKEKNFKIKGLSDNYLIQIKKQNKSIYLIGNCLPLNNNICQKICSDKSALSEILSINNIPCVAHKIFSHKTYLLNWTNKEVEQFLIQNNFKLIIKDNQGSCGKNVFLVKNKKELNRAIKTIISKNLDIAVSPYIENAKEYRLIMLDKTCLLCYLKEKPFVIGNGKSKLKNLIKQKYGNFNFEMDLKELNKKPKENEKVILGWKNNLKLFATPKIVEDEELKTSLINIGKKVMKTINARFCSVDIFEVNNNFSVLEVNSTVSMECFSKFSKENYNITKHIFNLALNKAFEM